MQEPLEAGEETNKFSLFSSSLFLRKDDSSMQFNRLCREDESFDPFCNLFHDERVSTFRL